MADYIIISILTKIGFDICNIIKLKNKNMLTKTFTKANKALLNTAVRGVYTAETAPHVFINKHTRVLVQGMTGKHGTFHTE